MATSHRTRLSSGDYTVACICPMDVEFATVEGMLDEIHAPIPFDRLQNAYTLGRIGQHNVVIAILPETGTSAATSVAVQLLNDFSTIRFALLVGIGGGVPGAIDVRLGDVVVSQPNGLLGGVVQYDLGKRLDNGKFQRIGLLNKPPQVLTANVRKLKSRHRRLGHQLSSHLAQMIEKYPKMQREYSFPEMADDHLFVASYPHQSGLTCSKCDLQHTIERKPRPDHEPYIFHGTIASANVVMKDATIRDELQKDMNVVCVEMEAAGLMDSFPCLVIRGICDYADSHKNEIWQPYAAAMAAAYMKELLMLMPAQQVVKTQNAESIVAVPKPNIESELSGQSSAQKSLDKPVADLQSNRDEMKNQPDVDHRKSINDWKADFHRRQQSRPKAEYPPFDNIVDQLRVPTKRARKSIIGSCAMCDLPIKITWSGEKVLQFSCDHTAHEKCLQEWLQDDGETVCPTCDRPLMDESSKITNPFRR